MADLIKRRNYLASHLISVFNNELLFDKTEGVIRTYNKIGRQIDDIKPVSDIEYNLILDNAKYSFNQCKNPINQLKRGRKLDLVNKVILSGDLASAVAGLKILTFYRKKE